MTVKRILLAVAAVPLAIIVGWFAGAPRDPEWGEMY